MNEASTILPHVLSKSTFMRGCKCHKNLWLHKHRPDLRDEMSEEQAAIFQQGTDVGQLARSLFPGGVDASPPSTYEYQLSVAKTQELIAKGYSTIYEAAFQFDGVLAAIDVLVKRKGKWYGYEVKSSTKVKEEYLMDAALQYYVITNAGIELKDLQIIFINNKYKRNGEIAVEQLFSKESVLKGVKELQAVVNPKIPELKKVIAEKKMPEMEIGKHCGAPYPCDFEGYCWGHLPEDSVFSLTGQLGTERAVELYRQGIVNLSDIPPEFKLGPGQRMHVDVHRTGEAVIDRDEIRTFLESLKYPLYYLDFETYRVAVPEYDGHWPYQQLPFQFSLHIQRREGEEPEHIFHLSDPGKDPCEGFIKKLKEVMGSKGSVVVYNKAFENTRLNELKIMYPDCAKAIENIQSRMVDLMTPFLKRHYYTKEMHGSYSIKSVLPALLPDFSYENLSISDGGSASLAFYQLRDVTDATKIEEVKQQLLEYCKMDTMAMVRILGRLREVVTDA